VLRRADGVGVAVPRVEWVGEDEREVEVVGEWRISGGVARTGDDVFVFVAVIAAA